MTREEILALGPGPELDALVAKALGFDPTDPTATGPPRCGVPVFSQADRVALLAFQRMPPERDGGQLYLMRRRIEDEGGPWGWEVGYDLGTDPDDYYHGHNGYLILGQAESLALAICLAVLHGKD